MTRSLSIALLAFSVCLPAAGDEIDVYVRERMRQLRLPGLSLAVVRNGKATAVRSYGLADIENDLAVTPHTVFELGSLTKQFTAAALMMLVEDGRIAVDDSIAKHLTDVPEAWRAITVRHLLTHSGGIQEYLAVPGLPTEAHEARTHDEMTRILFQRLTLEFSPGETWAYSNPGYLLLGNIIERVSGQSYWEFLDARIFTPLGMRATRSSDPGAIIPRRSRGYGWIGDRFENRPALTVNAYSAGSIVSTIRDMIRWEAALHGKQLLTRQSYDQMWQPLAVSGDAVPPFHYAFGWVTDMDRGDRAVFHSGGTPGFSSAIRRYPERGVSVILLANHGDRIIDHMVMEIAGIAEPALARPSQKDVDPALTKKMTGVIRDLMQGRHDPEQFTPAMRLFLKTSTGHGLWDWIGSHGELKSLTLATEERTGRNRVLRYRAVTSDAQLWFSVTMTESGQIGQIVWW